MDNKRCIILHGCPAKIEEKINPKTRTYDKHWISWTRKQLEKKGIRVETPLMPTPWEPDYEKFKAEFEKHDINENTILIGHSCGCVFLVRWLGETKTRISKLVLVAPGKFLNKKNNFKKTFRAYKIDKTIKNRVGKIIMFTSNNEKDERKGTLKIFHKVLGGEIINLKNHGHYCFKNMGTEEFPELLEKIIN